MAHVDLAEVATRIASRGVLAADESTQTVGKRLEKVGLENTEENRRAYREVYMTCPGFGEHVSGIILYKETLTQKTGAGKSFVECLREQNIAAGIKVDEGLQPLAGGLEGETWTKGLDTLADAAKEYAQAGAQFAKWRATIKIQEGGPSEGAILRNAEDLATYAAISQAAGLVPIVEPEILIDGVHDIARFQQVTERVIAETVTQMWRKGVLLEGSLLKPQMVLPGADHSGPKPSSAEVALRTVTALRRVVPAAIPGILFLSGGQSEEEATINLDAINTTAASLGRCPWRLSFSFGRALQHSVLKLWADDPTQIDRAQVMALALAQANSQASMGAYQGPHPSGASTDTLRETFRGWRT
mmetsp:Transcript_12968/g.22897  ORF Transcript_12968/g.22897 Transcript_12968/m.22897 type:complete len:358 (-) Transcript_12968:780-1853(-)